MDISLKHYAVGYGAVVLGSFLLATPYVPYTRPFSVIALSLLGIGNALAWLFVASHLRWRVLGTCVNLLLFLPLALYLGLGWRGHYPALSTFLLAVVLGNFASLWKLAPNSLLRHWFVIQQIAVWYVAQMTLYLDAASVAFPSHGWSGNAVTARLLFWPPLLAGAISAISTVSRWRRLYTVLILAALAQIGNGMVDLWGMLGARWLQYVGMFLWLVFLGGMVYLGILWFVHARNHVRASPTSAPPEN